MKNINNIVIPDFNSKEFKLTPKNPFCEIIDSTRLIVEVLWWLKQASWEFSDSELSSKLLIDGQYALVIRYKREKDWKYHPACTLSFDEDENWNISLNQLQWSKDKHIAFRFHSSFNHISFYLKLIEESFSKRWVFVYVKNIPEWLEWASYSSNAFSSYNILRTWIIWLNKKYGLEK